MIQFNDIRKRLKGSLRTGQCVSFPVPVLKDGVPLDAFFVFTVDMATRQPSKPSGVYLVSMQDDSISYDSSLLGEAEFHPSDFRMPRDYGVLRDSAYSLYGAAREEVFSGKVADSAMQYASTVWGASQDSLRPYYKMLSPALFANCE